MTEVVLFHTGLVNEVDPEVGGQLSSRRDDVGP